MPGCFKNKINDGKSGGDGTLMWNQRRNLSTITVLFCALKGRFKKSNAPWNLCRASNTFTPHSQVFSDICLDMFGKNLLFRWREYKKNGLVCQ